MKTIVLIALLIIAFIVVLILLWYNGKKKIVKQIILHLVIQAEVSWGSGTGKIKFAEVVGKAYSYLPYLIRIFVTYNQIVTWIEEAVDYIKTELQGGKTIENVISK